MTAYWTLAIRYADAASARPIAGDHVASRFMNADAQAVAARFQPLKKANASFPIRHRLIDERLADELTRDRGMRVIVVGCGFDSRAYRLEGGRWVEIDEGALLAYKEERLPAAEAPNELVRVPIRFAEESLEEKLRPFAAGDRAAVVLEGVIGYLSDGERRKLLTTLTDLFPHHVLVCDMLTRTFLARYARKLVKLTRELGPSSRPLRTRRSSSFTSSAIAPSTASRWRWPGRSSVPTGLRPGGSFAGCPACATAIASGHSSTARLPGSDAARPSTSGKPRFDEVDDAATDRAPESQAKQVG